jgi:hypothetical protein
MNREFQFEAAYLQRRVRAEASRLTTLERRRLAVSDALVKRRQQTQAMLAGLQNDLRLLDQSIADELENSPTRDPLHFAFPMTVRALTARRDNLKATISLLLLELTKEDTRESAAA